MTIRFQADNDLDRAIVRGVLRRCPAVDFQFEAIHAIDDLTVLHLSANQGRILVSHDRRTMSAHFARLLQRQSSPGLILVPQDLDIGAAIEDLLLIWAASDAGEWRDRIDYLPL